MKRKIFSFLLTLILLIGLASGMVLLGQMQDIRKKASGESVILGISPSNITVLPDEDETFTVGVTINSGVEAVSATELHLSYDTSKIEAQSIIVGNFLTEVLTQGQVGGGSVSITLGCCKPDSSGNQLASQPINGSGILASIRFKALPLSVSSINSSSTSINIDSTTKIAAANKSGNVLQSATGAQVVVNALPSATVVPSATSVPLTFTPTPTVTPSLTPTMIPTSTPTPTLLPTPTNTPTLTPTLMPTYTPTPSPTSMPTPIPTATSTPTLVPTITPITTINPSITSTSATTPTVTAGPTDISCPKKADGDANCDGEIDGIDYSIWLYTQCRPSGNIGCANYQADYNKDGNIDDEDYKIWFAGRG